MVSVIIRVMHTMFEFHFVRPRYVGPGLNVVYSTLLPGVFTDF